MGTLALVGLGSNLGDRKAHLDGAIAGMAGMSGVEVLSVSTYHETSPVGGPEGQGAFLNAAVALKTALDPLELLDGLQLIESREGRVRTAHWSARTLDLDLLLYGDRVGQTIPTQNRVFGGVTHRLQLPHPWLPFRRFVLAPLAEVAPNAIDPLTGLTVTELCANLDRRPGYVAIFDPSGRFRDGVFGALVRAGAAGALRWAGVIGPFVAASAPVEAGAPIASRVEFDVLCDCFLDTLARDRWPAAELGDRWVVSNVWFDALSLGIPRIVAGNPSWIDRVADENACWERFRMVRSQIIMPTFAVVPADWARFFRSGIAASEHSVPEWGKTPLLEVDLGKPELIAEQVLTACAAARPV